MTAVALRDVMLQSSVKRSDHGIVVLSFYRKIIYMSSRAAELFKSIEHAEDDFGMPTVVPTAIEGLCAEIVKVLTASAYNEHWIPREIRRHAGHPDRPILLRGFALPNQMGIDRAHMVIFLEERSGRC